MTQVSFKLKLLWITTLTKIFHEGDYNQAQINEFIDLQNVESTLQVAMPREAAPPRRPENQNRGHLGKW